ncbi:MAG TPA: tripartite tricarboxylate transporter substrate-binding protein [Xanthobacteraceae bacterium]|nr:tripartite tricarboxylate transporter substrate-binding protein [Xanthobacteraceae bacterium]
MRLCAGFLLAAALLAAAPSPLPAQDATPFYKDKQIRIILSAGVAGGYMEYARTLAEHMGKHIAGNPSFLVQSMPGAGGLNATNHLYAQAPQDGTTIGIVHSTIPLAPLWGNQGVRYETMKFNWIGAFDRAPGVCLMWATSPVKTWADMLEKTATVGSSGSGSQMDAYPALLNKLFGAKIKIISGYKDGTSIYLAMERGEVDGRCGGQMSTIRATRPDWLTEKKIVAPIVISMTRHPDFPDTPTVLEFAKDDATRQVLELMTVSQGLDRPVLMPPNTPPARVKEIRDAFKATVTDPDFVAEIKRRNMGLDPVFGEEMTETLAKAFASPPGVIATAREALGGR